MRSFICFISQRKLPIHLSQETKETKLVYRFFCCYIFHVGQSLSKFHLNEFQQWEVCRYRTPTLFRLASTLTLEKGPLPHSISVSRSPATDVTVSTSLPRRTSFLADFRFGSGNRKNRKRGIVQLYDKSKCRK